jgi:hypothetical protein
VVEPDLANEICCAPLRAADVRANGRAVLDFARSANPSLRSFKEAILYLQTSNAVFGAIEVAGPVIVWDAPLVGLEQPLKDLIGQAALPADWEYPDGERAHIFRQLSEGLSLYRSVYPDHFQAFSETTTHLLFARRAGYGSGSVSNRVGMIWLAPVVDCPPIEYAENLLHEFLHQCLFLDEMVHTIFDGTSVRLGQDDARCLSAIRQERRGYDKSYHSAFVAFGLAKFYSALGSADRAVELMPPLLMCLDDLATKERFLTGHGRDLLQGLIRDVLSLHDRLGRCAHQK